MPRNLQLLALFPAHMNPAAVGEVVASMLSGEWEVSAAASPDADPEALASAEAILVALVPLTADHLAAARRLRFVQCPSHGFDHVDIGAAAERGIAVANVGTSGAEAANVAEHALLLALACAKRLVEGHEALRAGGWPMQDLLARGLTELRGKTLGIVGLGQIGRELAKRAYAFDMTLVYADPVADPEAEQTYRIERLELGELLERADVVSVHVPLNDATRGLLGPDELGRMKRGAILVNTSRGPVVDTDALAEALASGRILAGVDVFDPEPPPKIHPLLYAQNVVLSPHVAGVTGESVRRIMAEAIENLDRFARGEEPRDVVNA